MRKSFKGSSCNISSGQILTGDCANYCYLTYSSRSLLTNKIFIYKCKLHGQMSWSDAPGSIRSSSGNTLEAKILFYIQTSLSTLKHVYNCNLYGLDVNQRRRCVLRSHVTALLILSGCLTDLRMRSNSGAYQCPKSSIAWRGAQVCTFDTLLRWSFTSSIRTRSDGSKIMKWGPSELPTFKNWGPWNIMAAIIFELPITVMLYLDFQRSIVLYNFHVYVVFFKTVRECRNATEL